VRVLLVTGKGGVGKTTHALATAFGAAAHGHRTCVLSADPAHSLGDALARPVGAAAVRVAKGVVAREVNAQHELDRSWSEIQHWLRALLRDGANDLVAEELLVFPGLEELLALRAVREAEATGEFDVCVVDCAPTGATLRMLRFPDALKIFMENFFDLERRGARLLRPLVARTHAGRLLPREEFFDAVERLFGEVEDVRQILLDEARTSARLVVNPARVVVDETRRAYAYLCLYGVATDAVIVNRVLPAAAAGGWFERWAAKERDELAEIRASFDLPLVHAPLRAHEVRGEAALRALAEELYGERDPAARFAEGRPFRIARAGRRAWIEIDLPGASKEELDVSAHGDEVFVRVRDVVRRIALPASLAGRTVGRARLEGGRLRIELAAP
jgi:arsenite-transporting ATPase